MKEIDEEVKRKRRSYNMSRIHSKDTKPEIFVRHWLFSHGYRYRKNVNGLPGTPDIVLHKYSVCIFVHGCFWHGHDHITYPRTNSEFWKSKIEKNRQRDDSCKRQLLDLGWNIITIWECQLKKNVAEQTMRKVEGLINHSMLIKNSDSRRRAEKTISHYDLHEDYPLMAAEDIITEYKD